MRAFGDKVYVNYVGSFITGEIFDDHKDDEPMEVILGISAVLPGLEEAFVSMKVGEEREIIIPAEKAYGFHDPEGIIRYPVDEFPQVDQLVEGQMIEFFAQDGALCAYPTVVNVSNEYVTLDFNHPLAGKDLKYWIRIDGEVVKE